MTGEGTDVQRTYLMEKYPNTLIWSIFALMDDLQHQLDDVSSTDEAGKWQAGIIRHVDDMEFQASLSNLAFEDFIGTLDGSVIKVTPAIDVISCGMQRVVNWLRTAKSTC